MKDFWNYKMVFIILFGNYLIGEFILSDRYVFIDLGI